MSLICSVADVKHAIWREICVKLLSNFKMEASKQAGLLQKSCPLDNLAFEKLEKKVWELKVFKMPDHSSFSLTDVSSSASKAMKSSPLLGPFCAAEFWGFSLLKI